MRHLLLVFLILGACQAPKPESEPTAEGDAPAPVSVGITATPEAGLGAEDVPGISVYDDLRLHEVALTLPDASADALREDPYEWAEADAVVDGTPLTGIGVRLRGKVGSFRELDEKPKFKLDLDRFNEGQRLQGLDTLALNNAVVDCSYLKEMAGYRVFREMGINAPRTSYAWVTVNGEDYGLYVLVEYPNEDFLQDNFEDPSGNLYDGKYGWDGRGTYWLTDFTRSLQDNFELEEGTDVGLADVYAVTDALSDADDFSAAVEDLIDEDQLHTFVAAEQWIGHIDGYSLNINNYRVYFDPARGGRAVWIPWDLDYAFINAMTWGMSWSRPQGAAVAACWEDDACREDHRAVVAELVDSFDIDPVLERIDRWTALIADAAQADPRRECSAGRVDDSQTEILEWLDDRDEYMADKWDL